MLAAAEVGFPLEDAEGAIAGAVVVVEAAASFPACVAHEPSVGEARWGMAAMVRGPTSEQNPKSSRNFAVLEGSGCCMVASAPSSKQVGWSRAD